MQTSISKIVYNHRCCESICYLKYLSYKFMLNEINIRCTRKTKINEKFLTTYFYLIFFSGCTLKDVPLYWQLKKTFENPKFVLITTILMNTSNSIYFWMYFVLSLVSCTYSKLQKKIFLMYNYKHKLPYKSIAVFFCY